MLSALLAALTRYSARARAVAVLERFDDHRRMTVLANFWAT